MTPTHRRPHTATLTILLLILLLSPPATLAAQTHKQTPNNNQHHTTDRLDTHATYNAPYHYYDTNLTITTQGATNCTNVTLYYRYSKDNRTNWFPSGYGATLTLADKITKTQDSKVDYPQRLWYDDKNQLLYVVCYDSDTLQIYDATKQWDLTKIQELQTSYYLNQVHDIKVINNWTYQGKHYGNIALTIDYGAPYFFNTINCNLTTTPTILNSYNVYGRGGHICTFTNTTGHLIAAVTEMSTADVDLFDVSNPLSITLLSTVNVGTGTEPWFPSVDPTHHYLYVGKMKVNTSLITYDITNLQAPIYCGYEFTDRPPTTTKHMLMRYTDPNNPTRLITINATADSSDYNPRGMMIINTTNPLNWHIEHTVGTQSTGEFKVDYSMEWATCRHYISGSNDTGIDLYYIPLLKKVAYYGFPNSFTTRSHQQWLDMNRSRIFVLAFSPADCIYALNVTFNRTWYPYAIDTHTPWDFHFTFPNGTGYYEFCTRGWQGTTHEDFPPIADCIIHKMDNTIQVTTDNTSATSFTEATLFGTLIQDGGTTCNVGFQYGTTTTYGNTTTLQHKTSDQSFSTSISGLRPDTQYHYRAIAANNNTTGNGSDLTFKTKSYITITITKPTSYLYIFNYQTIPFPKPLILGRITVEVTATSVNSSITRVEFYLGSTLEGTATAKPFTWTWVRNWIPLRHTLTVKAYDLQGHSDTVSIKVIKIF